MKSGKLAKLFSVDIKTLYRWTDEYSEFFSSDARGIGRTQREYGPQDMIVINTIMKLRQQRAEPEKIRAQLAAGDFDTTLPPEATSIEGENAVMVYTQLRVLEQQVNLEKTRADTAEAAFEKERERNENLLREVGKWQALAELYEKLWKDEKDSDK